MDNCIGIQRFTQLLEYISPLLYNIYLLEEMAFHEREIASIATMTEAIASTLNEDPDNIEDLVEPFLLKIGFLKRTRKGREATDLAYRHLDRHRGGQQTLF